MDKLWEKMALYDLLVRLLTGVIVIVAAEALGIIDWMDSSTMEFHLPVWLLLLGGYFVGMVLEELSYMIECNIDRKKPFHRIWNVVFYHRGKIKREVSAKYPSLQYRDCKRKLIVNGFGNLIEEPLAHAIMSSSLMIAFLLFIPCLLVQYFYLVFCCKMSGDLLGTVMKAGILFALYLIFRSRAKHYSKRRSELIFDYYLGKYGKDGKQSEKS